ncbi:Uncharacterised protein [Enterobacter hormaechei]|nr:Uncharacterised protein [Enterobacter hormaechei]
MPGDVGQLRQLRHKYQDGQRVHETGDHRAGDVAHQAAQLQVAGRQLQYAGQRRGRQQILQAVVFYKRDQQQRHRTGGGRYHCRTAAEEGHNQGNTERRVEPDLRVDSGDDGKGDRFGNKRERDHNTGKDVTTDVTQPVLTRRGQQHSHFSVFDYGQPVRAKILRTKKHIRRRDVFECAPKFIQCDRGGVRLRVA